MMSEAVRGFVKGGNEMDRQEQNFERMRNNAFVNAVGIELDALEEDRAVFRLQIGPAHRNSYGSLHGGVLFTMADAAAGAAVRTDGRDYVTQNVGLNYLRGQREGLVRAEAMVRHRGTRTCLVEVSLTGEGGKLLATGMLTFFCVTPGGK